MKHLIQVALYNNETDKVECLTWVVVSTPQEILQKAMAEWVAGGTAPAKVEERVEFMKTRRLLGVKQLEFEALNGEIDTGGSSSLSRALSQSQQKGPLIIS